MGRHRPLGRRSRNGAELGCGAHLQLLADRAPKVVLQTLEPPITERTTTPPTDNPRLRDAGAARPRTLGENVPAAVRCRIDSRRSPNWNGGGVQHRLRRLRARARARVYAARPHQPQVRTVGRNTVDNRILLCGSLQRQCEGREALTPSGLVAREQQVGLDERQSGGEQRVANAQKSPLRAKRETKRWLLPTAGRRRVASTEST